MSEDKKGIPAGSAADAHRILDAIRKKAYGELLTGKRGPAAQLIDQKNGEFRNFAAVYSDGTVLFIQDSLKDQRVSQILQAMTRMNAVRLQQYVAVPPQIIEQIYADAEDGSDQPGDAGLVTTKMQENIIALIKMAHQDLNSSDIHMTVGGVRDADGQFYTKTEFRIDGLLEEFPRAKLEYGRKFVHSVFAMLDAGSSSATNFSTGEVITGRISAAKRPELLSFGVQAVRVLFSPLINDGTYMVMRILAAEVSSAGLDKNKGVEAIGYLPPVVQIIRRSQRDPKGGHLIAGITGSGKTVSQAIIVAEGIRINRGQINVTTIEEPVEVIIEGAKQTPKPPSLTFGAAIMGFMRADIDELVVGEIRDAEAAEAFLEIVNTGHRCRATTHADSPIGIIDRFRAWNVEEYKVTRPTFMKTLMTQNLIRKLCPHCKIPFGAEAQERLDPEFIDRCRTIFGRQGIALNTFFTSNPNGCDKCSQRGFKGRLAVAECISTDDEFMKHVRDYRPGDAIKYWRESLGGILMVEHAFHWALRGEADLDDIEQFLGTIDPDIDYKFDRFMPAKSSLKQAA